MVIIIESCDKAGKTTLVESLAKKIGAITIKINDRPKNGSPEERKKILDHYNRVWDFLWDNKKIPIILDRFFPSEICYSIKRGYEAFGDPDLMQLEKDLSEKLSHVLVLCDPGIVTIRKRFAQSPDEHVNLEELESMYYRYKRFFRKTKLTKLKVDTNKPVEELTNQIYEYLRSQA